MQPAPAFVIAGSFLLLPFSRGDFKSVTVSASPTSLQCASAEGQTKLIFSRCCGYRYGCRYHQWAPITKRTLFCIDASTVTDMSWLLTSLVIARHYRQDIYSLCWSIFQPITKKRKSLSSDHVIATALRHECVSLSASLDCHRLIASEHKSICVSNALISQRDGTNFSGTKTVFITTALVSSNCCVRINKSHEISIFVVLRSM